MMKHFGYFPTESSTHNSEYLPYFRRTPELKEHFGLAHQKRKPKSSPESRRKKRKKSLDDLGEMDMSQTEARLKRSLEYSTGIIEAALTNEPFQFNGNVMNDGLISNLPQECCVEVPCVVDAQGIHPCRVGELPPQLAAINRSNITVHELAVRAVLDRDREAAFHACALDPLTASLLPLDKIREMFEELWKAEGDLLLWFDPDHKGPLPEVCDP